MLGQKWLALIYSATEQRWATTAVLIDIACGKLFTVLPAASLLLEVALGRVTYLMAPDGFVLGVTVVAAPQRVRRKTFGVPWFG